MTQQARIDRLGVERLDIGSCLIAHFCRGVRFRIYWNVAPAYVKRLERLIDLRANEFVLHKYHNLGVAGWYATRREAKDDTASED